MQTWTNSQPAPHPRRYRDRALHAATPPSGEFIKFLNAVERAVPAGKIIHAIADNYAAHKHPSVLAGSPTIRVGSSTSHRLRPPDSTPSKASSRSSPGIASGAAPSNPSPTCRTSSSDTSANTTKRPNPSSGPNPPTPSSPSSPDCLYPPNESVHLVGWTFLRRLAWDGNGLRRSARRALFGEADLACAGYSAAAGRRSAREMRAAQNLNSGILPQGSRAGLVRRLAAASA